MRCPNPSRFIQREPRRRSPPRAPARPSWNFSPSRSRNRQVGASADSTWPSHIAAVVSGWRPARTACPRSCSRNYARPLWWTRSDRVLQIPSGMKSAGLFPALPRWPDGKGPLRAPLLPRRPVRCVAASVSISASVLGSLQPSPEKASGIFLPAPRRQGCRCLPSCGPRALVIRSGRFWTMTLCGDQEYIHGMDTVPHPVDDSVETPSETEAERRRPPRLGSRGHRQGACLGSRPANWFDFGRGRCLNKAQPWH